MNFNGLLPEQLIARSSRTKSCIIVGDAPCKHREYAEVRSAHPKAALMVLNDSGRGMELVPDYIATMHGSAGNFMGTPRMPLSRIPDSAVVASYNCNGDEHERVDHVFQADPVWGTCALFGTLCALYFGYGSIKLVGCPLEGAYGGGTKLEWWKPWAPWFDGRVQAMSGNLIAILEAV